MTAPIKGMSDLASPEVEVWQSIESTAREILSLYGFCEVRTPIVEQTSLFSHSLGDESDVVRKEMYQFQTPGGNDICLRPEGTAGIMRWVASQGYNAQSARIYYIGPMFRYERPQQGRKRQFHQVGVEAIGEPSPVADVEIIALQAALLEAWGVEGVAFEINTRGDWEDHARVKIGLETELLPQRESLCQDCQRRLATNILRVLDCKVSQCRRVIESLPPVTDFMSAPSREYLGEVQRLIDGLNLNVTVNPLLVRGLDYYQHTVWEVRCDTLGAQSAVSGGGRYQVQIGKKTIDGVGFAVGVERIVAALQLNEKAMREKGRQPLVWLVALDPASFEANLQLMQQLRAAGLRACMETRLRKMNAQMKAADKAGATQCLIRGESEMANDSISVKNMTTGKQEEIPVGELVDRLRQPG